MTLLSSKDVFHLSGVTNATLLRWVHSGVIVAAVRPDGQGSKAFYSPHETQVVRALSRFPKQTPWKLLGEVAACIRAEPDWNELALVITQGEPEVCKVDELGAVLELAGGASISVLHLGCYQAIA